MGKDSFNSYATDFYDGSNGKSFYKRELKFRSLISLLVIRVLSLAGRKRMHENLHISTGLKDVTLAKAIGLKDEQGKDYTDYHPLHGRLRSRTEIGRTLVRECYGQGRQTRSRRGDFRNKSDEFGIVVACHRSRWKLCVSTECRRLSNRRSSAV